MSGPRGGSEHSVFESPHLMRPQRLDLGCLDKFAGERLRFSLGECRLRRSEPCADRNGIFAAASSRDFTQMRAIARHAFNGVGAALLASGDALCGKLASTLLLMPRRR